MFCYLLYLVQSSSMPPCWCNWATAFPFGISSLYCKPTNFRNGFISQTSPERKIVEIATCEYFIVITVVTLLRSYLALRGPPEHAPCSSASPVDLSFWRKKIFNGRSYSRFKCLRREVQLVFIRIAMSHRVCLKIWLVLGHLLGFVLCFVGSWL